MAVIQPPAYFFDPSTLDRLKNGDIPTEAVFRDLLESVAFFKRLSDSATTGKAGLVKTATDARINNRDNSDLYVAGNISPYGWRTAVSPAQIPIVYAAPLGPVSVTPVPRTGADPNVVTDGSGIRDYEISLTLPLTSALQWGVVLPVLTAHTLVEAVAGNPYSVVDTPLILNQLATDTLEVILQRLLNQVNQLSTQVKNQSDYNALVEQPVGTYSFGAITAAQWASGAWLRCDGSNYLVTAYPQLYAAIGNIYGGAVGLNFNVPNIPDSSYMQVAQGNPIFSPTFIGGASAYSLTVANIPQHTHSLGTLAITADGLHTHTTSLSINSVAGVGAQIASSDGSGANTPILPGSSTAGPFAHVLTGSLGNYGQLVPTAIPIVPNYFRAQVMIKAKGYV